MKLVENILNKLKNELSIEDLNSILLYPIYDIIYSKIFPYYITIILLLSMIIILLIVILCYIIFKY
jgi:hypothetical protein